ncbi:MAG: O-antigen ligase family protein [Chloroflexi bacterium]|nr:O-antigen ligase family protein [Chloroflexota bacterium]
MPRQRRRNRRKSRLDPISALDGGLRTAQLVFLSIAIIVVPFIVLPESSFADITSTSKATTIRFFGTLLGGVLASRLLIKMATQQGWIRSQNVVLRLSRPAYFILVTAALVAIVSLISTALSIAPGISLWGRNPAGFEAGEYTALMYVVFAVAVIVTVREMASFERVWATVAISGIAVSSIGVFQFHGIAFLDIAQTHRINTTGTAGNPIFYGALLVLMAPISLAFVAQKFERASTKSSRYWLAALVLVTGSFTVSLITTASRGPILGWMAGLVVFAVIAFKYRSTNRARLAIGLIAASTVGFALLAAVYEPPQRATPTPQTSSPQTSAPSTPAVEQESPGEKFEKITRSSTVRLRLQYWSLAADVALDRPEIPYSNNLPAFIRWLVGYGPDTFRYVATAEAEKVSFTGRFTAAHNDPINRLVEQGLLGLIAWLALWLAIAYALWRLAKRSVKTGGLLWLAAALAAALTARFVEQLTGSPTAGDVFVFWILVGLLAAVVAEPLTKKSIEDEVSAVRAATDRGDPRKRVFVFPAVIVIAILAIFLSWETAGRFFFANNAGSVLSAGGTLSYEEADARLDRATSLAPEVAGYWHSRADLEHGKAQASSIAAEELAARQRAYVYDKNAFDANPLELTNHYRLAFSAWELGKLGNEEKRIEAVELYVRLTELAPADSLAAERLEILRNVLNP